MDAPAVAAALDAARAEGRTLAPLSDTLTYSMEEAYAVQRALTALRVGRGESRIGWKLGYTSLAMREQMGVATPNFGPLTDAMRLWDGAPLPATALQPRVEPEIGVVLGRDLGPDASPEDVRRSIDHVVACLEVVDSVWTDYRFRIEDNTADGSSAAWVVVGGRLRSYDLAEIAVALYVDGAPVASATGAAAGGHPAYGVAWLADQLAARGEVLEAGSLVITGGLTAAVPLAPGSTVSATFSGGVDVGVRRAVAALDLTELSA